MESRLLKGKRVMLYLLFIYLLTGLDGVRFWFHGRYENKLLRGPSLPPNVKYPREQWFTQKLDHFNRSDGRNWQQRFYTNATFYTPGGPVFLMVGGEGPIGVGWMLYGQWMELAKLHRALCFQLEHRFYGKSHPTKDMTMGNIAYLSSEQALADIAYFITTMNEEKNLSGSKWIVFGGSYPGSLAVWTRLKYPHLVHGAVSSSAPLLAKADFKEYLEVVQDSMATVSEECVAEVKKATKEISSSLALVGTTDNISQLFSLCGPLDATNKNDVSTFYELLADNWALVVQYNPFVARLEDSKKATVGIRSACQVMTKPDGRTSMQRYGSLNTLIMKSLGESCLDISYENIVNGTRQTNWGEEHSMMRQWMYQSCSEFGFFQTSDSLSQLFGNAFPLSYFVQECTDVFGSEFTAQFLESAVERTNTFYGGVGIETNRVIFVQGSNDPWHALGVTNTSLPDSIAIYIDGTSHCADMMPSYAWDPPQLKAAHEKIKEMMDRWLQ